MYDRYARAISRKEPAVRDGDYVPIMCDDDKTILAMKLTPLYKGYRQKETTSYGNPNDRVELVKDFESLSSTKFGEFKFAMIRFLEESQKREVKDESKNVLKYYDCENDEYSYIILVERKTLDLGLASGNESESESGIEIYQKIQNRIDRLDVFRRMAQALANVHRDGFLGNLSEKSFGADPDLKNIKIIDLGTFSTYASKNDDPSVNPLYYDNPKLYKHFKKDAPTTEDDHLTTQSKKADIWALGLVLHEMECKVFKREKVLGQVDKTNYEKRNRKRSQHSTLEWQLF